MTEVAPCGVMPTGTVYNGPKKKGRYTGSNRRNAPFFGYIGSLKKLYPVIWRIVQGIDGYSENGVYYWLKKGLYGG